MNFKEALIDYGFSQEDVDYICTKTNTRGVERVQKTLRDYEIELGISKSELKKMVLAAPGLLGFVVIPENQDIASDTSVRTKIADYMQLLNLSKFEVINIIKKFPQYLGFDTKSNAPTSLKSKITNLQCLLGFNNEEVVRFVKKYPQILAQSIDPTSNSSLNSKIEAYAKLLNVPISSVVAMVRKLPQMLTLDINSTSKTAVKTKIEDYAKLLEISKFKVTALIAKTPEMLTYDVSSNAETSIKSKLEFYKRSLGVDSSVLGQMVAKCPVLLGLDTSSNSKTSVRSKLEVFGDFLTTEDIINNPIILTFPAMRTKLRFMILANCGIDRDKIVSNQNLMTSEQVMWGKVGLCKAKEIDFKYVTYPGKFFMDRYGFALSDLAELFPLQNADISNIEAEYNSRFNKKLNITQAEIEEILK
ncbi:MAG: hypothetical protein IJW24_00690 [Clostridia bacterium]|nr:hypothetical protein [Clostridia bacterium]